MLYTVYLHITTSHFPKNNLHTLAKLNFLLTNFTKFSPSTIQKQLHARPFRRRSLIFLTIQNKNLPSTTSSIHSTHLSSLLNIYITRCNSDAKVQTFSFIQTSTHLQIRQPHLHYSKKHTFSTFSTPNYRKVEKKSYLCTQNKQKGNNKTEKNN